MLNTAGRSYRRPGVRPLNPNEGDQYGCTPLHHVVETGHVAAARLLLEAEAKVDACESVARMTPLFVAAARGQPLHCPLPSGGWCNQRPSS